MVTSRIWFTPAQKAELRERWKNGQSAAAISRALERKNKTGVERIVVLVPARLAAGTNHDHSFKQDAALSEERGRRWRSKRAN